MPVLGGAGGFGGSGFFIGKRCWRFLGRRRLGLRLRFRWLRLWRLRRLRWRRRRRRNRRGRFLDRLRWLRGFGFRWCLDLGRVRVLDRIRPLVPDALHWSYRRSLPNRPGPASEISSGCSVNCGSPNTATSATMTCSVTELIVPSRISPRFRGVVTPRNLIMANQRLPLWGLSLPGCVISDNLAKPAVDKIRQNLGDSTVIHTRIALSRK